MIRKLWLLIGLAVLTGCTTVGTAPTPQTGPVQTANRAGPIPAPRIAGRNFVAVVDRMLPIAVQECQSRTERRVRCDYRVVVDDRPNVPPNAFQTVADNGQPVIGFTLPLIAQARNQDELAFILGHEAAHHIAGHIPRGQRSALQGALLAGTLAALGGANEGMIREAQEAGAFVGSRRFSKEFELEADKLGTIITQRAGYNPIRGVAYFTRIPDPGNQFLGTHPPNAQRIELVRRTAAGL